MREKLVPAGVSANVLDTSSIPVSNRAQSVRREDKSPNQTREDRMSTIGVQAFVTLDG